MRKTFINICAVLAAVSACRLDTVGLQKEYSAKRDSCQELAELKVEWEAQRSSELQESKMRNAKLVDVFTDCMSAQNWDVGRPKEMDKLKDTPATIPTEERLVNRGVGVGVGPSYALEKQPVTTESALAPHDPNLAVRSSSIAEPAGFEPQVPPVTTQPYPSNVQPVVAPLPVPAEANTATLPDSTTLVPPSSPAPSPVHKRPVPKPMTEEERLKQLLEKDSR